MEASVSHPKSGQRGRRTPVLKTVFALAIGAAAVLVGSSPIFAQSATSPPPASAQTHDPDKLYVDADDLLYDKDNSTVTATGSVVMYYKNRILQADRVVYDRVNKRVRADGHAKFTDEHGNITYAPSFDLTDDFASGFANGAQMLSTDKTRFTSPRVERSAGTMTTMDRATYTACEPCKAHPEWPPEWQVRAVRITEDQQTHTIYFENAWLDIFGIPVIYVPYMSAPDPTVTRKSGFLPPSYTNSTTLGYGVTVPYFLDLAPNYDLTITPSYYTNQGAALDLEWRHRIENGEYTITLSGIDQSHPSVFIDDQRFRGSAQSQGKVYLNDKWTVGWDLTLLTDRYYITDYKLLTIDPSTYFFQDIVSQIYLRGQDGRGYFDLSAYSFESTFAYLDERQEPVAAPVLDYQRTFPIDPKTHNGIGGEISVELNAANIDRTEALYQSVGAQKFDTSSNLYSVCTDYTPGRTTNNCLLRGIAGDYARATTQISWQSKYVDPLGEVWKPFIFGRVSGEGTDLNTSDSYFYGTPGVASTNGNTIPNSGQTAFFNGQSSGAAATGMAGVGIEYRYPFVSNSYFGQQTITPIGQLIVRPNEVVPKLQPNEDAQSLVFDTSNLFAWDKYSGYDRVEGGTRFNYGLDYTDNLPDGGHAQIMGGESIQLAGQNSYTIADAANTGLDSGLDRMYSDFVAGETLQPFSAPVSFTTRQQFDPVTFNMNRFDGVVSAHFGEFGVNVDYARYAAQPELGWPHPREGVTASASYKPKNGFFVNGSITLDMSRHYYDVAGENTSQFLATGYTLGAGYETTCTTFSALYANYVSDPLSTVVGVPAPTARSQIVMFQLTLRTLGDIKASETVSSATQ
jgi:LPS-assembly protein